VRVAGRRPRRSGRRPGRAAWTPTSRHPRRWA